MRAAQGHAHDRCQDAIELGAGQGVRERLLRYFRRRRLKAWERSESPARGHSQAEPLVHEPHRLARDELFEVAGLERRLLEAVGLEEEAQPLHELLLELVRIRLLLG